MVSPLSIVIIFVYYSFDHCGVVSGRQNSSVRQYHVLFFGDEGERGWVLETTSLPYDGRAAFDWHCQSMIAKLPARDRKNYVITPNRRRAWEVAVSSAEHARMLSREQRIDEFIPPMSSSGHSLSSCSNISSQFSSAGGHISEPLSRIDNPDGHGNSSAGVLSRSSGRDVDVPMHGVAQEQFASFCRRNRKSLCLMHPGFTEEQINRLLLMQWTELDSAEKSKYTGCMLILLEWNFIGCSYAGRKLVISFLTPELQS